MNDSIRLRGGGLENMPRLADREPAYVRDQRALYIGTAEGNVCLAVAGTEERTAVLEQRTAGWEATAQEQERRLTTAEGELKQQADAIAAHAESITTQGETLDAHGETLEGVEGVLTAHGSSIAAAELKIAGVEAMAWTHEAALEVLHREKLTATAAAPQSAIPAGADLPTVIAACNALLAALRQAGIVANEERGDNNG